MTHGFGDRGVDTSTKTLVRWSDEMTMKSFHGVGLSTGEYAKPLVQM
jgi:hypothetical protein